MALEAPGTAVFLEQALPEAAGALVGVLLGGRQLGDHLGRTRSAQPSRTPGKKLLENVPACSTTSGASDHSDGSDVPSKGSSR